MAELLRLLQILRTFFRYRLDQLLPKQHITTKVKIFLFFARFFPEPALSRGERIRKTCEDLGPVFVKFGQLLSTRPDLIPADIIVELNKLQDDVPPFDSKTFHDIVEQALEQPLEEAFAQFSQSPLASASVAQVHTATLHDGTEVVVKVIRPGIEEVIEQDVNLLFRLAYLIERFAPDGRRMKPVEVVEDYQHTIFDELNLQQEAANASQLKRNFAQSPQLYIPEIYWDLTRKNVLVMERIYGIPVTDIGALKAQKTDMKLLAERGVEIFFTQVFKHNFFHADMHPGNIFVSRQHPERPTYIAVDMAIVGTLDSEDQYYLARNLLAMFRRDYRQVAELHIQSGWIPPDTRISNFEGAIRSVCEPIFEKPLKEISFGHVLIQLFQTARRFNMEVQPQLILLQKTLLNIEGMGRQLYPDLDLWTTAHPFLEQWLRDRFHAKSLVRQLQRHGPEWMEKFPEIPHLIYNSLTQTATPRYKSESLPLTADNNSNGQQKPQRRMRIAVLALAGAIMTAWPGISEHVHQLPVSTWILTAIAALAWVLR